MQSRGASDESGSRRCATRGSELRTPPGDSLRHPAKSGLRVLRTGRSSPAAPHPASRRRSCSRLHTEHVHMERTCTARTKCAHRRTRGGGPPPRDALPDGSGLLVGVASRRPRGSAAGPAALPRLGYALIPDADAQPVAQFIPEAGRLACAFQGALRDPPKGIETLQT